MCGCVFIGWVGVEVSIWVIASRNTETEPHVLCKSTIMFKWEMVLVKKIKKQQQQQQKQEHVMSAVTWHTIHGLATECIPLHQIIIWKILMWIRVFFSFSFISLELLQFYAIRKPFQ